MSWTCAGCEVRARFTDPARTEPPNGWARQDGRWLCLACRRELARALPYPAAVDLELERAPQLGDTAIARVTRQTAADVGRRRAELVEQGRLPAPRCRVKRPYNRNAAANLEAAIRAEPSRDARDLAKALGVSDRTVARVRARLKASGEIPERALSEARDRDAT